MRAWLRLRLLRLWFAGWPVPRGLRIFRQDSVTMDPDEPDRPLQ